MIKLDIGCGCHFRTPLEEWTHLDGTKQTHTEIVCDWKMIPLGTETVDEIYIGDVVEHIVQWQLPETLGEWNRVLKMGGVFGGTTPNVDRVMRDYANGSLPFDKALCSLYGWATDPTQQHYMTYKKETLTALMLKYGFQIDDYSQSPGAADCPWWLVFSGRKVSRTTWRNYA